MPYVLQLTGRCNLTCEYCIDEHKKTKDKSIKDVITFIDTLDISKLHITGGEVLLRRDIFELLDYLYDKGIEAHIYTNAINYKMIPKEYFYKIKKLYFSIDAYDSDSAKISTRGELAFIRTIEAIDYFNTVDISIATVITKFNVNNLNDIAKLINKDNVVKWTLRELQPMGEASSDIIYNKYKIEHEIYETKTDEVISNFNSLNIVKVIEEDVSYILITPALQLEKH